MRDKTLPGDKLTLWQRSVLKKVRRGARKREGEELTQEDWGAVWSLEHSFQGTALQRFWHLLPHGPRCGMCGAPFAGIGKIFTKPLGYTPSRKNPHMCATCVELAPPGGATMDIGVLFADLRGFTAASESASPEEVSRTLRRFYGSAEKALFPEAIIDKLIGDEVMALYVPAAIRTTDYHEVPALMVEQSRRLLRSIGYGTAEGPFVEVGIGIDFGEAFIGNLGETSVFDFTAVGDVVNTASRLQGQARGGEIIASEQVATMLGADFEAERLEVELKGKSEPQRVLRIGV